MEKEYADFCNNLFKILNHRKANYLHYSQLTSYVKSTKTMHNLKQSLALIPKQQAVFGLRNP